MARRTACYHTQSTKMSSSPSFSLVSFFNSGMEQKCVTALDQTWHPDHFFCTQCGCQFGEDGFQEKDGKPYCKEDYLAMFALKCKGCTMAITEGYISALSGQWHPQCFVCRVIHSFSSLNTFIYIFGGTCWQQS